MANLLARLGKVVGHLMRRVTEFDNVSTSINFVDEEEDAACRHVCGGRPEAELTY